MNPITKSLDEVGFRIPREILELVFINPYQQYRDIQTNIKDQIRRLVVNARVLVDTNLVGGQQVMIQLDNIPVQYTDNDYSVIYRIPKSMTDGRAIMSVLNVTYGSTWQSMGYGNNAMNSASPAQQLGAAAMEAQLRSQFTGSARVQLIGENVVMVRDTAPLLPVNLYLLCVLENDEYLNHIQIRSYRAFSRLVELAVKAYIYNTYVIELDIGQIRSGVQIGRIREIIDGYADANEMYLEFLTEKWQKVMLMNDNDQMRRLIGLMTGGCR